MSSETQIHDYSLGFCVRISLSHNSTASTNGLCPCFWVSRGLFLDTLDLVQNHQSTRWQLFQQNEVYSET
jgi:hypothetical protein